jgi:hypothetical protein
VKRPLCGPLAAIEVAEFAQGRDFAAAGERNACLARTRAKELLVISVHHTLLHHEKDLFGLANVNGRITGYRDDIRELSGL